MPSYGWYLPVVQMWHEDDADEFVKVPALQSWQGSDSGMLRFLNLPGVHAVQVRL